jgi:hypothetical protein
MLKSDDDWNRMTKVKTFLYLWFIFVAVLAITSLITGAVVAAHFIAKFW